jgi:hypothetical protein
MDFIYQNEHSICPEFCEEIIEMYEMEQNKYDGLTIGGVQKKIKDTTDFIIPKNDEKWSRIESFLYKELHKNILKYIQYINREKYNEHNNNGEDSSIFTNTKFETQHFMIQKYDKNKGQYIYHNDFHMIPNKYRVITFLWYLNDVNEGGETEFWDYHKIKPTAGKMILFPASWTYPHRGLMPISSNKYIITNWLYINI